MNWKWIVRLSSLGVLMGIASVQGFTRGIETWLWLASGVLCAIWLVRVVNTKHFLNGFMVGLIGGGIAPVIQIALFSAYLSNNPGVAEEFNQMQTGFEPRTLVVLLTPVIAVMSGAALGLLTWIAGRIFGRRTAPASAV